MQVPSSTIAGRRLVGRNLGLTLTLFLVLGEMPLSAQYTSPGDVGTTNSIVQESLFETHLNEAEWNLGSVRLRPWLGVRDASFVTFQDDLSDPRASDAENDFTATVGAGLRGYLPTGKLIWAVHALPEYVWWEKNENKSGLNGRFGLGVFGYFNRLRFEVSQRRLEEQNFFSSEVQELTTQRNDTSRAAVEIDIARRLELFGIAELNEIQSEEDESALFPLLDRDEEAVTVGLRYRSPRGWMAGLAYEDSSTDFPVGARQLSNSGTSELVSLGYEGTQFSFRLNLAFRSLEGDVGSEFGDFDETTGAFEALWAPSTRSNILAYSRREQGFSVNLGATYSLTERQGVRLSYDLGQAVLGLVAEVGEDEFATVGSGNIDRIDDVTEFGADLQFEVADLFDVALRVRFSEYDSNFAAFDRDITTVGLSIQLGSLIEKLKLGEAGGDW